MLCRWAIKSPSFNVDYMVMKLALALHGADRVFEDSLCGSSFVFFLRQNSLRLFIFLFQVIFNNYEIVQDSTLTFC